LAPVMLRRAMYTPGTAKLPAQDSRKITQMGDAPRLHGWQNILWASARGEGRTTLLTTPSRTGRVPGLCCRVAKGLKGQMQIRVTHIAGIPVFGGEVRPEVRTVAMRT
jgi:hypothetical protein